MDQRTIPSFGVNIPPETNTPVAPPSYEEALQTPAPDLELGSSDDPPPAYSGPSVDDQDNDGPPQCSDDQTRLIVVRVWRRVRCGMPQDQRVAGLSAQYRRNRCIGLVTSLVVVACVVSAGVFFGLRTSDMSSDDSSSYDPNFNLPALDQNKFKWTPSPINTNLDDLDPGWLDSSYGKTPKSWDPAWLDPSYGKTPKSWDPAWLDPSYSKTPKSWDPAWHDPSYSKTPNPVWNDPGINQWLKTTPKPVNLNLKDWDLSDINKEYNIPTTDSEIEKRLVQDLYNKLRRITTPTPFINKDSFKDTEG